MSRTVNVENGKIVSVYLDGETVAHLSTINNVSDYIRRLITEATDAGNKVKIAQEVIRLRDELVKAENRVIEIRTALENREIQYSSIERKEIDHDAKRQEWMKNWREFQPSIYHGSFWPNLSWLEDRIDVWQQDCGFKSPEEAFNWFNEHRNDHKRI